VPGSSRPIVGEKNIGKGKKGGKAYIWREKGGQEPKKSSAELGGKMGAHGFKRKTHVTREISLKRGGEIAPRGK